METTEHKAPLKKYVKPAIQWVEMRQPLLQAASQQNVRFRQEDPPIENEWEIW